MTASARDRAIELLTEELDEYAITLADAAEWAVDALLARPEVLRALAGTTTPAAASGYVSRAHHCAKPSDGRAGDVWRCECGREYKSLFGFWLLGSTPNPTEETDHG